MAMSAVDAMAMSAVAGLALNGWVGSGERWDVPSVRKGPATCAGNAKGE